MSLVKISGNASGTGTLTIAAPNTSTDYTLTLPAVTTTLAGTDATQTLTNKTLTSPTVNSPTIGGTPVMGASVITSGTVANTTSGTSVTFSSIPSWVKRITVMLNNVTISGSTVPAWSVRIGPVGGIESTGYVAMSTSNGTFLSSTTGFIFRGTGSASAQDGTFTLNLQNASTNTWCASGVQMATSIWQINAGTKSLAGTLTQLQLVTNGTDTFTAGSVNILYE